LCMYLFVFVCFLTCGGWNSYFNSVSALSCHIMLWCHAPWFIGWNIRRWSRQLASILRRIIIIHRFSLTHFFPFLSLDMNNLLQNCRK
jgi:hypothetical protein